MKIYQLSLRGILRISGNSSQTDAQNSGGVLVHQCCAELLQATVLASGRIDARVLRHTPNVLARVARQTEPAQKHTHVFESWKILGTRRTAVGQLSYEALRL